VGEIKESVARREQGAFSVAEYEMPGGAIGGAIMGGVGPHCAYQVQTEVFLMGKTLDEKIHK
jgi:hypothetical protein